MAHLENKPIYTCIGGAERADSVLAALQALPATVSEEQWVLVHDAARPVPARRGPTRLLAIGQADPIGAILAAPVRDTIKRSTRALSCAAPPPSRASNCGAR
jgi:2-C-methyl-D-erythritol 4-phosphate cytidylyltransferase